MQIFRIYLRGPKRLMRKRYEILCTVWRPVVLNVNKLRIGSKKKRKSTRVGRCYTIYKKRKAIAMAWESHQLIVPLVTTSRSLRHPK
jgi:hypothetical protein